MGGCQPSKPVTSGDVSSMRPKEEGDVQAGESASGKKERPRIGSPDTTRAVAKILGEQSKEIGGVFLTEKNEAESQVPVQPPTSFYLKQRASLERKHRTYLGKKSSNGERNRLIYDLNGQLMHILTLAARDEVAGNTMENAHKRGSPTNGGEAVFNLLETDSRTPDPEDERAQKI